MKVFLSFSTVLVFIYFRLTFSFQISQSATVVVDGVSVWKNPTVQVGDSISYFYFSFNNGSAEACQERQKMAVKVSLSPPPGNMASSPELPPRMAAPPISSGGIVSSSPAYPWPFQPKESASPSPAPRAFLPATSPMVPDKNVGIPFINSNPAVPLPTGEVDSATIHPIPTSGIEAQVVGMLAAQISLCHVFFLLLLL